MEKATQTGIKTTASANATNKKTQAQKSQTEKKDNNKQYLGHKIAHGYVLVL